jgi:hypothetical protein
MKASRSALHYAWVVLGALVVVMLLGSGPVHRLLLVGLHLRGAARLPGGADGAGHPGGAGEPDPAPECGSGQPAGPRGLG